MSRRAHSSRRAFQGRLQAAIVASVCLRDLRSRIHMGRGLAYRRRIYCFLTASGSASSRRIRPCVRKGSGRLLGTLLDGRRARSSLAKTRKSTMSGCARPRRWNTGAPGRDAAVSRGQSQPVPGMAALEHAGDQLSRALREKTGSYARLRDTCSSQADGRCSRRSD